MRCPQLNELPPPPSGLKGWPWTEESPQLPAIRTDGSHLPRVTVVTPSYNQADFLEETIRSVLLQGYPDLEYIIMDGGSTDGSVEIIQKYAPWLAYWVSEKDGGQADAINKGWRRATGEVLTWLNSDDTLAPESLKVTVTALGDDPQVEFVYGNVTTVDSDAQKPRLIYGSSFVPEAVLIQGRNPIPQPGFLMKRRLWERVGELDPRMHFCMDFDYWSRIALQGVRAVYLDCVLAHFRQHAEAKTSVQHKIRIANRMRVFEKVFASPDLPLDYREHYATARNQVALTAAYIAYKANDASLTREYAWEYLRRARLRSAPSAIFLFLSASGGRWIMRMVKRLLVLARRHRLNTSESERSN